MTTQDVLLKMQEIWDRGHAPDFLSVERQTRDVISVAHLADLPARIIGYHTSKSVRLPVSMLRADVCGQAPVYFVMRDNFHDLKLVVVSSCPINVPYALVHPVIAILAAAIMANLLM